MAEPLNQTEDVFNRDDNVRKIEFLPIPNITADFQVNLNTEVLLTANTDLWDRAMGLLREEGFRKTFRLVTESTPATGKLSVIGPNLLIDGETFSIDDGVTVGVFEFDTVPNGVGGGNIAVDISAAVTIEDVRIAVEAAINGSSLTILAQPTRLTSPTLGSIGIGGEIDLENTDLILSISGAAQQNVRSRDTVADERFTHAGMSGASAIRATGAITVVDPSLLIDQDEFTIPGSGANPDETFEFDDDASVTPGNTLIDLTVLASPLDVQVAVKVAINTKTGTTGIVAFDAAVASTAILTVTDPANLVDGETFTLDDGVNTPTIFEFDTDASVSGSNTAVDISTAVDFRDVRAAVIAAINGVGTLDITAFNAGFGKEVELTNDAAGEDTNTTSTNTVVTNEFALTDMAGGVNQVNLGQNADGTIFNEAVTEVVQEETFKVQGMSGGKDAGWDVTPGTAGFSGYTVFLKDIPRIAPVVGEQNFMKIRVRERKLTVDTDPDIINVDAPGIAGTFPGANQFRFTPSVIIESINALEPVLVDNETSVTDGVLAELDATNGETIVAFSEVPIRSTKFGRFLEPQNTFLKVDRAGDDITGQLRVFGLGGTNDTAIKSFGDGTGEGGEFTGGATNGIGAKGVGQGTGAGFSGAGGPSNGTGVEGFGGGTVGIGIRGTGGTNGPGVRGEGGVTAGDGVFGLGTGSSAGVSGLGSSGGGPGVLGTGAVSSGGRGVQGTGDGAGHGGSFTGGSSGRGIQAFGNGASEAVFGQANGTGIGGSFTSVSDSAVKGLMTNGGAGDAAGDFRASGTLARGIFGSGAGSGPGVVGSGGGISGIGVEGIGGGPDGISIQGTSPGTGTSVLGRKQTGSGIAIHGLVTGTSASYAIVAEGIIGAPTLSALRVVPQTATPLGPNLVGDMFVTAAGVLTICTVAGTPGTFTVVGAQT